MANIVTVWSKRLIAWILIAVSCISLAACEKTAEVEDESTIELQTEEDVTQLEADSKEPLVVFHLGESPAVLTNFMNAYPDIELETHSFADGWEGEMVNLDFWVQKYGEPDIILSENRRTMNSTFEQWYEEGWIADLREFCALDDSIVTSDYVPGTFEVIDNGEALLGLPLTWRSDCMIIRTPQWVDSELALLPENYTGEEFCNALVSEFEKGREEDEFFWSFGSFDLISLLYRMNAVKEEENGEITIDEDLFELLYEFEIQRQIEDDKVRQLYSSLGGSSTGNAAQYQGHPAMDPEMYAGNYFGCTLYGAPQVTAIYAKSVAELHEQGIKTYWLPNAEDGSQYTGMVYDVAFVGGNSARQQEAYEVIRLMMDTPMEYIIQPFGGRMGIETYSPVNVDAALQMLEYFEDQETELYIRDRVGNLFYTVEKQKLSDEEKQQIQDIITGMTHLEFEFDTTAIENIYWDYVNACLEGAAINHKQCYFEIMRTLNPDSEKWNMTPDEVEEFLNQE